MGRSVYAGVIEGKKPSRTIFLFGPYCCIFVLFLNFSLKIKLQVKVLIIVTQQRLIYVYTNINI